MRIIKIRNKESDRGPNRRARLMARPLDGFPGPYGPPPNPGPALAFSVCRHIRRYVIVTSRPAAAAADWLTGERVRAAFLEG